MTFDRILPALLFGVVTAAYAGAPALAANARQPYSNIDRRVDKGGDTGDSQVERLNQQQLDQARVHSGTVTVAPGQSVVGAPMMGAPMMQQTVPGTVMAR